MCTYKDESFKIWLEGTLRTVMKEKKIKEALEKFCEASTTYYPDIKIWFAEKLGKRWSYITGAGQESFTQSEKVSITNNYGVFLQNADNIPCDEKDSIIALMKIICTIKA